METKTKDIAQKNKLLKELLDDVSVKSRFEHILGKKAAGFISSIISAHQANKALQECDPQSILAAAAVAASLDLPINPSLGQAALVPYNGQAQFQMQWKGYVQLAHRTSKYRNIHLAPVYEGQLVKYDEFRGTVDLDAALKKSELVMGFYFFFELTNGFRHEAYWSVNQCLAHGWKFSKSFSIYGKGQWPEDPLITKGKDGKFDAKAFKGLLTYKSGTYGMCAKTVVKNELSKWGPLSTEMQDAVVKDQAVFGPDGEPKYIDTTADKTEDSDAAPEGPKRKSEAALPAPAAAAPAPGKVVDAEVPAAGLLVEKVEKCKGEDKWRVLIAGRYVYTEDEATANAANDWAKAKTLVEYRDENGTITMIQPVQTKS